MKLTELGIVSDTDSSLYGYHIFYAVENGTSDTISAGLEYNSLSINGYMTDYEVNVFVKAMVAGETTGHRSRLHMYMVTKLWERLWMRGLTV